MGQRHAHFPTPSQFLIMLAHLLKRVILVFPCFVCHCVEKCGGGSVESSSIGIGF